VPSYLAGLPPVKARGWPGALRREPRPGRRVGDPGAWPVLSPHPEEDRIGTKPAASEPRSNPFAGKTFVITGTLARRSKDEAQMSIEVRGGKVTGAPSKRTDYVLAGEKAGTKLDKARALGVTVLSELDFEQMIQQAGPVTKEQRAAYLG
jgi:BRCT domain type II-containing protein